MALTPVKSAPPSVNTVLQSNPGDKVASGKSEIAPVVAVLSRQLPLPQAQQLAGQTAMVRVVKSGPGNEAELEFAGQNIQVKLPPGRALTAGEMVTVAFALSNKGDDLSAGNAPGGKRVQDARNLLTPLSTNSEDTEAQESPSFVNRLSGAARLIGMLEKLSQSTPTQVSTTVLANMKQLSAQFPLSPLNNPGAANTTAQSATQAAVNNAGLPLPATAATDDATLPPGAQGRPTANPNQASTAQANSVQNNFMTNTLAGALAKQVSAAIETSGLFYESHLQEWANGQRSTDQISKEPQARFGPEQVIREKGMDESALNQSVKMVTTQLAALDNNRINITLNGLFNQPIEVEIEKDREREESDEEQNASSTEEPSQPWVARLKLDMAHLGELQVRLRMIGSRCDVQIMGQEHGKKAIDPHWQSFQQAMQSQGIQLVHGQFMVKPQGSES